jgi:hypothetical protein
VSSVREPLRLVVQNEQENPMVYIVANILHLYGIEPDLGEIATVLGDEQFIDGDPMIYLLNKGLSVRTIWSFDPEQFLIRGHRHFRDISYQQWTAEQAATDDASWTEERQQYWLAKTRQWIEAFRVAGWQRRQREVRDAELEDVREAVRSDAMALVVLQTNPFETIPALVFDADEHDCLYIYSPMWRENCVHARSPYHFKDFWKQESGVQMIWR